MRGQEWREIGHDADSRLWVCGPHVKGKGYIVYTVKEAVP